ncbi:arrestin domain-containing protein 3 [Hydra vulgaris]|uniref:Arrestin domain-containing protein 3 n=1 Tax=Hydra vulgaris TaxID=6087 RepID=A0ABM4C4J2_HYDVU
MVKLTEFAIIFDNNREVFYPGEEVTGSVVMGLSRPMEMRGIKLIVAGKGYCHWCDTSGSNDNRQESHHDGNENLFEYQLWIHGGTSVKFQSEAGQSFHRFKFTLPVILPSSFEGPYGHIRYLVSAEIDKPWKFNHKTKRPFTVNEIIDTNLPQYNSLRPSCSNHKQLFCCCRCVVGPLDIEASIDRSAYCPGELIMVTAQARNNTTRDMAGMKAYLYKHVDYISTTKKKTCSEKVAEMESPSIPGGQSSIWQNQPFSIPATSPSILTSRVIKVWYELTIQVDESWRSDSLLKLPIIIGTVPYRSSHGQVVSGFQYINKKSGSAGSFTLPNVGFMGYPEITPPSYAAAAGATQTNIGNGGDKYTFGNMNYVPVYTFNQMSVSEAATGTTTSQNPPSVITEQPQSYPIINSLPSHKSSANFTPIPLT